MSASGKEFKKREMDAQREREVRVSGFAEVYLIFGVESVAVAKNGANEATLQCQADGSRSKATRCHPTKT